MTDRALIVHESAEDDVVEIAVQIAFDNPEAAARFESEFRRTCEVVLEFPYIGSPRRFRAADLRGLRSRSLKGFEAWLVFCRVTSKTVDVMRVVHGARDLRRALRS